MVSKITLYEKRNFQGRSKDFTKSCPDLLDAGFDDITTRSSSIKCKGGVWILYSEKNYEGFIFVLEDGDVFDRILFGKIEIGYFANECSASSLKLLDYKDFTEEPVCTLYKDTFAGRSLTFTDDVQNLVHYKFDKQLSSIVVKSGAWVGYTEPYYKGQQSLFRKGSYKLGPQTPDEGGFANDALCSFSKIMMKPSGKMKLKSIDYDLERSQILKSPSTVFRWTQVNETSVEQTVTKTDVVTESREDTYEFRWDESKKIARTITVDVDIPFASFGVSAGISLSKEKSVSIGSSAGINTSKTEKWIAEYPSKIPPFSRVTVTSKVTQGKTNIPFIAILYYEDDSEHTFAEKGVFYGCNFFDLYTEFKETKLPNPE